PELTIELVRFLSVLQSALLQFPGVRIHKRNLLKPRVVIASYNDHCSAPFSRALVGWHHQSLIGRGSRHCYGINYTQNPPIGYRSVSDTWSLVNPVRKVEFDYYTKRIQTEPPRETLKP